MYIPATVKCDVCEEIHSEVNGWFSILTENEDSGGKSLVISPFNQKFEREPAVCGESCLHKFISQNLTKIKETV